MNGVSRTVIAVPTIVAAAYATGDLIGDKLTLSNVAKLSGGVGTIMSITVADKAKQDIALDIVFFAGDPTGTTFTDNAALTVTDADLLKIVGVVSFVGSDYADFADNSVATINSIGLGFNCDDGDDLYAAVVSRGAPTYVSATDLQIKVTVLQD